MRHINPYIPNMARNVAKYARVKYVEIRIHLAQEGHVHHFTNFEKNSAPNM